MTQQLKLTNNEIIAKDLFAFIHRGGVDCLAKHLTLDCDLSEAEKREAWANAYIERGEIAKAKPKPMVWHNGRLGIQQTLGRRWLRVRRSLLFCPLRNLRLKKPKRTTRKLSPKTTEQLRLK